MTEDMTINAFIFDLGGVLLNWDPRRLYQKRFPKMSSEEIDIFFQDVDFANWNLEQDKGRAFDEAVAELSRRFPHYDELIQAYHRFWPDSITGPVTGTVKILEQIKGEGYAVYGLTNFSSEKYQIIQDKFDFIKLLDDVIVSGDVKVIKPNPVIYTLTLERIGYRAKECVYIDDSFQNIAAARSLGFLAIHFQSPAELARELRHLHLLGENLYESEANL